MVFLSSLVFGGTPSSVSPNSSPNPANCGQPVTLTANGDAAWKKAGADEGLRRAFERAAYSPEDSGNGTWRGANAAQRPRSPAQAPASPQRYDLEGSANFPLSAASLTFVSSSQVQVPVYKGGATSYTATLNITNPGRLTTTQNFHLSSGGGGN